MKKLILITILITLLRCNIAEDTEKKVSNWVKDMISQMTNYGNRCGPWNDGPNTGIDDLDSCCVIHDAGWQEAKDDKETYLNCGSGLRSDLDAELVECVSSLDSDPLLWENPAEDPEKANSYIDDLMLIFKPCMSTN